MIFSKMSLRNNQYQLPTRDSVNNQNPLSPVVLIQARYLQQVKNISLFAHCEEMIEIEIVA